MTRNRDATIKRIITEHIGEGTVAIDVEGRVTFANPAAIDHLGLESVRDLVEANFHDFVHQDDQCPSPSECVLAQGLATGAEVQSHADIFTRGDGTSIPVAYTLTWFVDDDAEAGSVLVFRDMSRYRDMQVQLVTTDRMAAMGMLASGVAHEMNNPLAYIKSNILFVVRVLEKRQHGEVTSPDDEVLREALVDSLEGIDRMENIVVGMRSFTDVEEQIEDVDIRKCLADALSICEGWLQRHAEVVVREEKPLGRLRADGSRLTQVFVNLLLNAAVAIEESGARGTIEVVTGGERGEQFVEIRDDGIGIDEALGDQIYDPFFTTQEAGPGMGLGLYICRCIIEELGGTIAYRDRPGGGAAFRVTLPNEEGGKAGDEFEYG